MAEVTICLDHVLSIEVNDNGTGDLIVNLKKDPEKWKAGQSIYVGVENTLMIHENELKISY